ncbi:MAG TPA: carboxypeptidase-like regulatory domain-containing protein [Thermoanaerobaculia bacterium]|nr:carboxypeptidase-like regulatory domain-containing protein [Thermoanaerobaculia bacterium]
MTAVTAFTARKAKRRLRSPHSKPAPALFLVIALFTLTSHAAVTTTALTGRVVTGTAPAAGVTVTVTSPALQHPRTVTTNAHGFYWIAALPPGVYEVSFSRSGLSSLIRPALLELGRVARADAHLEVNEDEDSVTSTAIPMSVVDDPALTSHFDDGELDRLPLPVDRLSAARYAPGPLGGPLLIDDAPVETTPFLGYEVVEQLTVFRGAMPLDFADGNAVAARTRSGGEQFTLSIRDTYFAEEGHLFETASGGSIVSERLWFFAGGWGGVADGASVKLTGQPGAAHNLVATYLDADGESLAALRYTGIATERLTAEGIVTSEGFANARGSWVYGDHVLMGGASDDALYAGDRWSRGRVAVSAGLRFEDDRTSPRLAATYDVRGNGRQALTASFGRYAHRLDIFTAGFASAIGSTGTGRLDYLHRDRENELQLDVRYSLFGRLQTGGGYTYNDSAAFAHRGHAWVGAELPLGEHEIGATLLERYERDAWASDLAFRYTLPFPHFRLTLATDVTNAFQAEAAAPRTWRAWLRARL